jgi:RNA polymerase sigma factor (sigma-70 family)
MAERDTLPFRLRLEGPTLELNENGLQDSATTEVDDATELFARYSASVYRYCLRRLGSPEEAEDALQGTYLNAWRSLKRGVTPEQPRAWLFQIAANVCATVLRSKLGGTRLELRDPATLDQFARVEHSGSEELLGLSEALRDLPARQRRALVLRDWQGLSYDEIAAEMAVSDAAVETLLFRARKKVALTLANTEWRGRLAPSARAILIWPFAFLREKSVAPTGTEQLKFGLTLAGGTVVPLVVFGVVQGLLPAVPAPAAQAPPKAAVSYLEGPQSPGPWAEDSLRPHASRRGAVAHETDRQRNPAPRRHNGAAKVKAGANPNAAHPPANAVTPAAAHEPKIVLCHETPSEQRPGVTISVSKNALAGLGKDTLGTCE